MLSLLRHRATELICAAATMFFLGFEIARNF